MEGRRRRGWGSHNRYGVFEHLVTFNHLQNIMPIVTAYKTDLSIFQHRDLKGGINRCKICVNFLINPVNYFLLAWITLRFKRKILKPNAKADVLIESQGTSAARRKRCFYIQKIFSGRRIDSKIHTAHCSHFLFLFVTTCWYEYWLFIMAEKQAPEF